MTALRGCPCCNGWMRYDQLACNECNGTNSRESYRKRIANLNGGLHAAAIEELRTRAAMQRIATALASLEQRLGGPTKALVMELIRVWRGDGGDVKP